MRPGDIVYQLVLGEKCDQNTRVPVEVVRVDGERLIVKTSTGEIREVLDYMLDLVPHIPEIEAKLQESPEDPKGPKDPE